MCKFKSLSFLIISLIIGCNNDAPQVQLPTVFPVDFLSSAKYDMLIVEIGYIAGFQPNSATVDNIKAFLQQRLNKPGGITVIQNEIPSQGKNSYSPAELLSVESSSRSQKDTGTTITIFMFFADGDYASNLSSLKSFGLTMSNSSLTVFEKTIRSYSGASGQPSVVRLESTVALHELGHMFGLCYPVTYGGYPQLAGFAILLRYFYLPYRLWKVTPGCHSVPDNVQLLFCSFGFKVPPAFVVYAR